MNEVVCSERGFKYFITECSVTHAWETWEVLFDVEVFVDSMVGKSVVLSLVSLHLRNEVHEVAWLLKQLKLLGVDHISQLILYLDH